MNKSSSLLLLFFLSIAISSCFDNTEKYQKISGEWGCISWINQQRDIDYCDEDIYFEFNMDKTYRSELRGENDSGTYKIVDQMLYVSPEGKQEFSVRLQRLSEDTTVFVMNSAGEQEILTLYKQKD